jgi:hypothetical protein
MDNLELNLLNDWQKLSEKKFITNTTKKQDIMKAINTESVSAISKLKKRMKAKINWIIFFIISFSIWMMFSINRPELLVVLGITNLIYIISFFMMWSSYKKMDSELDLNKSTLEVLKKNASLLNNALSYERLFGLFTFPLALIFGVLISNLYNGHTISETFDNQKLMMSLMILIVIVVPFMYLLSEKMNKIAFGKLKEKLEKNIIKLEMFQ